MAIAYQAFISYSHGADGKLASQVQRSIQHLAKPWFRRSSIRVFRDVTSLSANPGLWSSIEQCLSRSQHFILMASQESAKSLWVTKEVQWWLDHRGRDSLLIVVTDGKIRWDSSSGDFDWESTTCLPPILAGHCLEEPLFVDLRWAKGIRKLSLRERTFRAAILTLAAPLHGRPKDELDSDDIRQHRRFILASVSAGLVIVALAMLSLHALQSARLESAVARSNQLQAESRRLAAKSLEALNEKQKVGDAIPLAVLAWRLSPTSEALDALRSAEKASSDMARILGKHTSSIQAVAFSPDSASLATASGDGAILLWSIASGTLAGPALAGEKQLFKQLVFDSHGSHLLALGVVPEPRKRSDNGIRLTLWNLQTGVGQQIRADSLFHSLFQNNNVDSDRIEVDLSLDAHRVAIQEDWSGTLALWDDENKAFRTVSLPPPPLEVRDPYTRSLGPVFALHYLAGGELIILLEAGHFHDYLLTGKIDIKGDSVILSPALKFNARTHFRYTFSPNGLRIVGWGYASPALWSIEKNGRLKSLPLSDIPDEVPIPKNTSGSAGFDQLGRRLFVTDDNGIVVVWDLENQKILKAITVNRDTRAALSPDGRWLAAYESGQVVVFDLNLSKPTSFSGRPLDTSCNLDLDQEACIHRLCERISDRLTKEKLEQLVGPSAHQYVNWKGPLMCSG